MSWEEGAPVRLLRLAALAQDERGRGPSTGPSTVLGRGSGQASSGWTGGRTLGRWDRTPPSPRSSVGAACGRAPGVPQGEREGRVRYGDREAGHLAQDGRVRGERGREGAGGRALRSFDRAQDEREGASPSAVLRTGKLRMDGGGRTLRRWERTPPSPRSSVGAACGRAPGVPQGEREGRVRYGDREVGHPAQDGRAAGREGAGGGGGQGAQVLRQAQDEREGASPSAVLRTGKLRMDGGGVGRSGGGNARPPHLDPRLGRRAFARLGSPRGRGREEFDTVIGR